MNIAIFLPFRGDIMTGEPRTFLNLINGLKEYTDWNIFFVSQKESVLTHELRNINVNVHIEPFTVLLNNKNQEVLNLTLKEKAKTLFELIKYNIKIGRFLKSIECDVLITRSIKYLMYTFLGAKIKRVPLIWDVDLEPESKGIVKIFHLIGLLSCSKAVTQAKNQPLEIFSKPYYTLFRQKFKTIYPGIDDNREKKLKMNIIKNPVEDEKLKIVCVGTVIPRKNQKIILESIKDLNKNSMTVDFIGPILDEGYYRELQHFINNHNLEEAVNFLGWRNKIPELLGNYDLFVLCSKAEGTPQVLREAMFAGLPAIVSNVGGMGEVVEQEETGYILEDFNAESLKDHIKYFATNKKEVVRMGNTARNRAEILFSKENWIKNYAYLLRIAAQEN